MSPASTEGWFTGSTGATALTFRSPRRGSDEQTSRVGGELNAVEEQDSVDHRFQTVRGQVERPHVPLRCAMIEIAARGIGDPQAAVGSHYAVAGEYRGAATKCATRPRRIRWIPAGGRRGERERIACPPSWHTRRSSLDIAMPLGPPPVSAT